MSDATLAANRRDSLGSRSSGRQRRAGRVPAVVYGLDATNEHVTVDALELNAVLSGEGGANTLITLQVDGDDHLTLARQIQRDPVRGDLLHVDFVRVDVDVAVAAEVPVTIVGEPVGVTDHDGVLDQILFTISIEAKPNAIPNEIEVDVSELDIGDQIRVEELPIPAGVTVTLEPDDLVVTVAAPMAEEELPEEVAEAEAELAEGEEAPEGEEGAEAAAEGGEEAGASGDESE